MSHSDLHYIFVHIALRQLAFTRPVELLRTLDSPGCEDLLARLLRNIDFKPGKGNPRTFKASDIKVSRLLLQNRPCAILQMPPPRRTARAYFVAIWSRYEAYALNEEAIASSPANQPLIDYFTLERTFRPTPKCPACLCRWDVEGTHHNFGTGPAPRYEEFVQFLTDFQLPKPIDDDFTPIEP